MGRYSVGFLFSNEIPRKVLLILKNRPEWQEGSFNGVGGHIEPGESAHECMDREFKEETDSVVEWEEFCQIRGLQRGEQLELHLFRAMLDLTKGTSMPRTVTDEEIFWFPVDALPSESLHTVRWAVPMALHPGLDFASVSYYLQRGTD